MALPHATESIVCFVGGKGMKTGSANSSGCTKAWWLGECPTGSAAEATAAMTKLMKSNGEPKCDGTRVNCNNNGAGKCRLIRQGEDSFTGNGIEVGMLCYYPFDTVQGGDRYLITAVGAGGGDDIDIDLAFVGNITLRLAYVGGAWDTLQGAADWSDATLYDAYILTNKNETVAATIDFDVGGGSPVTSTCKYIIGFDTRPPNNDEMDNGDRDRDGSSYDTYTELDGDGLADPIVRITDQNGDIFKNLWVKNTDQNDGHNGFLFHRTAGAWYGNKLINCKATGCFSGIELNSYTFYGTIIDNCVVDDNDDYGMVLHGLGSAINCVISNNVRGFWSYRFTVDSCIITDNTGSGLIISNTSRVNRCTIDSNGVGLELNDQREGFITNTIISNSVAENIKFVGNGLLLGDYNCLYNPGSADSTKYKGGQYDITVDPDYTDADGEDYTVQNPVVLYGGSPDADGIPSLIGASNKSSRPTASVGI